MMNGWLILLALVYAPASAAERDEEQLLAKAYHYDEAALG
jgi:hypothetical protein